MRINWRKLKKNIPNKVRTSPKTHYEIVWIDGFVKEIEGEKTYGETRFENRQIVLNTNQGAKESVHTMFHELLHALSEDFEANLTENQVRAMEHSFSAIREFVIALEGAKKEKK